MIARDPAHSAAVIGRFGIVECVAAEAYDVE